MAKKKLTPQIIEILLMLATHCNNLSELAQRSGFSIAQLKAWQRENQAFEQEIQKTLNAENTCIFSWFEFWHGSNVKATIEKKLIKAINHGVEKRRTLVKTRRDANGDVLYEDTIVEHIQDDTPPWVMKMAIPEQADVIKNLQTLVLAGVALPAHQRIVVEGIQRLAQDIVAFNKSVEQKQLNFLEMLDNN